MQGAGPTVSLDGSYEGSGLETRQEGDGGRGRGRGRGERPFSVSFCFGETSCTNRTKNQLMFFSGSQFGL